MYFCSHYLISKEKILLSNNLSAVSFISYCPAFQYAVSLILDYSKNAMRKIFVVFILACIAGGICTVFWCTEYKYSLPTPVPKGYREIKQGTFIDKAPRLIVDKSKPVFLHFFNPDCPCSRFNITHFKELVKQYGSQIDFKVVVMNKNKSYTEKDVRDMFSINVPVLFDTTLASACGVYSTPQAALVNKDGKLYYRGNYNKARYCTDKNSNYAQMAIDSLLNNKRYPSFDQFALRSYGCELSKPNQ